MKLTNYLCGGLVAAAISSLVPAAYASTSETELGVGVPNPTVIRPLNGEPDNVDFSNSTISTEDVDAVLSAAAPQVFGNHYTRDLANGLFAELNGLKATLNNSLRNLLLSQSIIDEVRSLSTEVNPVDLSIRQKGTSVAASVYGLTVTGSVGLDVGIPSLFCDAEANFEIRVNEVRSSYNAYSGAIEGTSVFYDVINEDFDCDTILGEVALLFVELVADIDGLVGDRIEDAINDIEGALNSQSYFSVKDFMDGFKKVIEIDPQFVAGIQVTPAIEFDTTAWIEKAQQLIELADSQGDLNTGVQLDLTIFEGSTNSIQFVLGHQNLDVIYVRAYPTLTYVNVKIPDESKNYRIYSCGRSGQCDRLYDRFTPAFSNGVGYFRVDGTELENDIVAVAESDFVGGLYSRVGESEEIRVINNCGQRDCR